jgi:predicted CoA-binding protein
MSGNSMEAVRAFLGLHRIAVVGVSRNERDFSRMLFRELASRGYDVVPVNPAVEELEGRKCFPRVGAVEPGLEGALVLTRAAESAGVVRECAAAGVSQVWLFRGGPGAGAVSADAVEAGRASGLRLVVGECPFMFLEGAGWVHGFHGWLRKLTGAYPN